MRTLTQEQARMIMDAHEIEQLLDNEEEADLIEKSTGIRPQWPDPPQRAPEHERSGAA
jgi:hypothetical protein